MLVLYGASYKARPIGLRTRIQGYWSKSKEIWELKKGILISSCGINSKQCFAPNQIKHQIHIRLRLRFGIGRTLSQLVEQETRHVHVMIRFFDMFQA